MSRTDSAAKPQSPTPESSLPRSSLLRVVSNAASLLTTELLNKATNFLIYALIARYELGLGAFGSFSLGLLLVYVFQVFASVGLPNLLTREIAQRVARTPRLLSNGLVAASLTSLLAMLAMVATPWLMRTTRRPRGSSWYSPQGYGPTRPRKSSNPAFEERSACISSPWPMGSPTP
ncbi:MAG: oligosaccharide flippase family protein [Pirellulaceae bacterium]